MALEARLQFAGQRTHLDPYDLKTLAQFILLGDPNSPTTKRAITLKIVRTF